MRVGVAHLPLHGGKAPRWLFARMKKLAAEILRVIAIEKGPSEILRRASDPFWFQAFGCVLGFDWHSSGLTTTTCGAMKEALAPLSEDLGVFAAGGKGKTSRKTPSEIEDHAQVQGFDPSPLVYASRMSAKVDSNALQDGYTLYHHFFLFDQQGKWCVVQQGMNDRNGYARRYHWLSTRVRSYVETPHHAICAQAKGTPLNLVAQESRENREMSTSLSREHPDRLMDEFGKLRRLSLPKRHELAVDDIRPKRLQRIFESTYERHPEDFETLLGMPGVGAKTLRAFSLLSELVYGKPASYEDPARYSFAHGGKDGIPYPVDRKRYDESIEFMKQMVDTSRMEDKDKWNAFRRLSAWQGGNR